jgi:phosphoadenosine phosphosulfate reductase
VPEKNVAVICIHTAALFYKSRLIRNRQGTLGRAILTRKNQEGRFNHAQRAASDLCRAAASVATLAKTTASIAAQLAGQLAPLALAQRLAAVRSCIGRGSVRFMTSFGLEDQAITHAITTNTLDVDIVTIDTGRLFPETYDVWAQTEERYGIRIRVVTPNRDRVEAFVGEHGINGFRASLQNRQTCCAIRKSEPLRRALAGADAWITGLRAEQSQHRHSTPLAEVDEQHGLIKINPLADWRGRDLARHIADHRIPYNVLHDRGFPSIGCAPCTRAVRVGEPERAGRWWWETDQKKECGLHLPPIEAPQTAPSIPAEREFA